MYCVQRDMKESIQTVPTGGFSPVQPDFSAITDYFDLSLLPDSEVPSPSNFQGSMFDPTSPLNMFPSPTHEGALYDLKLTMKTLLPGSKEEEYAQQLCFNDMMSYQSLTPSPSPSSYQSASPTGSYQSEFENKIMLEELLEESSLLQKKVIVENQNSPYNTQPLTPSAPLIPKSEPLSPGSPASCDAPIKQEQNTLLRQCLRDTTFQKKYNLKPFDFGITQGFAAPSCFKQESLISDKEWKQLEVLMSCHDELTKEKVEPFFNMAFEQLKGDIDAACKALNVSPDPSQWSVENVKTWVLWALRQYNIPVASIEFFNIDGPTIIGLDEESFRQLLPNGGETLHAQLEIWKNVHQRSITGNTEFCFDESLLDMTTLLQWENCSGAKLPSEETGPSSSATASTGAPEDPMSEDEEEEPEIKAPATTGTGRSGSHIHLWQFLKELLSQTQVYGSCIRWLDREKGVFKIEDSVRVARLWGKRKNRPAMNYDKLSRSIRQYYKKGIMKKTERSQRYKNRWSKCVLSLVLIICLPLLISGAFLFWKS